MTEIFSLPTELIYGILNSLDHDLKAAGRTCRLWRNVVCDILYSRGCIFLLRDNDPRSAIYCFSNLLVLKPSVPPLLFRCWSHMRNSFDRKKCLNDLEKAKLLLEKYKKEKKETESEILNQSRMITGFELCLNYRSEESLMYFDQVIDEQHDNYFSIYFNGYTHFGLGNYEEAIEYSTRLLASPLFLPRALLIRGASYQMIGEYNKGISDFMECIKCDFGEMDAVRKIILIYQTIHQYQSITKLHSLFNSELATLSHISVYHHHHHHHHHQNQVNYFSQHSSPSSPSTTTTSTTPTTPSLSGSTSHVSVSSPTGYPLSNSSSQVPIMPLSGNVSHPPSPQPHSLFSSSPSSPTSNGGSLFSSTPFPSLTSSLPSSSNSQHSNHSSSTTPQLSFQPNTLLRRKMKLLMCRATLLCEIDKWEEALRDYLELEKLCYWKPESLYFQLGWCSRLQRNSLSTSISYFSRSLTANPRFTPSLEQRGRLYFFNGDPKKGEKEMKEATKLNPDLGNYCFRFLAARLADKKKYKSAVKTLTKGIKHSDCQRNSSMFHERGLVYCFEGNWKNALSDFQFASKIEPCSSEYYFLLGDIYFILSNPTQAITTYQNCIQSCYIHHKFIDQELRKRVDDTSAHQMAGRVHVHLGIVKVSLGKFDEGLEEFQHANKLFLTPPPSPTSPSLSSNNGPGNGPGSPPGNSSLPPSAAVLSSSVQHNIVCLEKYNNNHEIDQLYQIKWMFEDPIPQPLPGAILQQFKKQLASSLKGK